MLEQMARTDASAALNSFLFGVLLLAGQIIEFSLGANKRLDGSCPCDASGCGASSLQVCVIART
jgi:hypothetical protein